MKGCKWVDLEKGRSLTQQGSVTNKNTLYSSLTLSTDSKTGQVRTKVTKRFFCTLKIRMFNQKSSSLMVSPNSQGLGPFIYVNLLLTQDNAWNVK